MKHIDAPYPLVVNLQIDCIPIYGAIRMPSTPYPICAASKSNTSKLLFLITLSTPSILSGTTTPNVEKAMGFQIGAGFINANLSPSGDSNGFYSIDENTSGFSIVLSARRNNLRGNLEFNFPNNLDLHHNNISTTNMFPSASLAYKIPTMSVDWIYDLQGNGSAFFARVGLTKPNVSVKNAPASIKSVNNYQAYFGGGYEFEWRNKLNIRASYEQISKDIQITSLSLNLPIGKLNNKKHPRISPQISAPRPVQNLQTVEADFEISNSAQRNFCKPSTTTLHYDTNSATPQPEDEAILHFAFSQLDSENISKVSISTYTDAQANREFNLELSKKRALKLGNSISQHYDINSLKIDKHWFGESESEGFRASSSVRALERKAVVNISCN